MQSKSTLISFAIVLLAFILYLSSHCQIFVIRCPTACTTFAFLCMNVTVLFLCCSWPLSIRLMFFAMHQIWNIDGGSSFVPLCNLVTFPHTLVWDRKELFSPQISFSSKWFFISISQTPTPKKPFLSRNVCAYPVRKCCASVTQKVFEIIGIFKCQKFWNADIIPKVGTFEWEVPLNCIRLTSNYLGFYILIKK